MRFSMFLPTMLYGVKFLKYIYMFLHRYGVVWQNMAC